MVCVQWCGCWCGVHTVVWMCYYSGVSVGVCVQFGGCWDGVCAVV